MINEGIPSKLSLLIYPETAGENFRKLFENVKVSMEFELLKTECKETGLFTAFIQYNSRKINFYGYLIRVSEKFQTKTPSFFSYGLISENSSVLSGGIALHRYCGITHGTPHSSPIDTGSP